MGIFDGEARFAGKLSLTLIHKEENYPYSFNITYVFNLKGVIKINSESEISKWVRINSMELDDCFVENSDNPRLPALRFVYDNVKDSICDTIIKDFKWFITTQVVFHKTIHKKYVYTVDPQIFPIIYRINRAAVKSFLLRGNDAV